MGGRVTVLTPPPGRLDDPWVAVTRWRMFCAKESETFPLRCADRITSDKYCALHRKNTNAVVCRNYSPGLIQQVLFIMWHNSRHPKFRLSKTACGIMLQNTDMKWSVQVLSWKCALPRLSGIKRWDMEFKYEHKHAHTGDPGASIVHYRHWHWVWGPVVGVCLQLDGQNIKNVKHFSC